MSGVLSILALVVLFALFGLMGPVLQRKSCHGEGEGGCGSCANAGHCELKEH